MFDPENGRLAIGRGRVAVMFAHYNYFGTSGNHTGDTFISVDLETCAVPLQTDIKLGWSWGASHSLYQQLYYDGSKFVSAALGDANPQNILFSVVYLNGSTNILTNEKLLNGDIPGLGNGKSSGRLGGLVKLTPDLFLTTYSRFKSTGTNTQNDKPELGIVSFNNTLNRIKTRALTNDNNVNTIKTAKFGNRLIIGYALTNQTHSANGYLPQVSSPDTDTMYVMVVTPSTAIVSGPIEVANFSISPSDDWETLSDGRVVWTYVGEDNVLRLWSITGEPDPNSNEFYGDPPSEVNEPVPAPDPPSSTTNLTVYPIFTLICSLFVILLN